MGCMAVSSGQQVVLVPHTHHWGDAERRAGLRVQAAEGTPGCHFGSGQSQNQAVGAPEVTTPSRNRHFLWHLPFVPNQKITSSRTLPEMEARTPL